MGLRPSIVVAKGAFRRERSTPNGVRINEKRQFGAEIGKFALPESDKRWRRRGDSNPRDPFESNGFQDRRFQPLTHSSVSNSSVFHGSERYFPTTKAPTLVVPCLNLFCLPRAKPTGVRGAVLEEACVSIIAPATPEYS